jgi:ubiquinone/menaquinone biosynthesis C-methylase UbiE
MDEKLQLRVQRYGWDAAAPLYDDAWRQRLAPVQRKLVDACDLTQGLRVVELASGSGLVTFPVAEAVGPDGFVLATDISGEMVAVGTDNASRLGLTNVTFRRMNSEALECEDASFDRALCSLGLMYMPNPRVAISEMKRVVCSGGRVGALVWGERKNCGWADIFPIVDARVKSEVCPLFFSLGTPGALASGLEAAGLSDITEDRIKMTQHFDSDHDILTAKIDSGAVALAAKRFDEETRRGVDEDFLASVSQFRNGRGYDIPVEFVIASGRA